MSSPTPTYGPMWFKPGHIFRRGDLPIYLTDFSNNQIDPFMIRYTLFYNQPGNPNPVQVGPARRVPVRAALGEYYVSGIAGDCGVAGDWFVEWYYQENSDSEEVMDNYPFRVVDSTQFTVTSCTPCGGTKPSSW